MRLEVSKEAWERELMCVIASRDESKVGRPLCGVCTQNVSLRNGHFKEQLKEKESMLPLHLTLLNCFFSLKSLNLIF